MSLDPSARPLRITHQPVVRYLGPDARGVPMWRLEETFVYHVGHASSADVIVVPRGFECDFASVPRPLWAIYPPTGSYGPAAIVHDYLYATRRRSRRAADDIFLEAMGVLGVPWLRRHLLWLAVRLGGWMAYAA